MIETITYQDRNGSKPYADWLKSFTDKKTKARILVRVNRMTAGNFGDCRPLRDGVQELKIDIGPGYRVYLSKQGPVRNGLDHPCEILIFPRKLHVLITQQDITNPDSPDETQRYRPKTTRYNLGTGLTAPAQGQVVGRAD